jgi:hypothetical protein
MLHDMMMGRVACKMGPRRTSTGTRYSVFQSSEETNVMAIPSSSRSFQLLDESKLN